MFLSFILYLLIKKSLLCSVWTQHTKQLPPLCVGDHVLVQNQTGPHPMKWDKTGWIVEIWQFDQYVVCIDGSGCNSLCNRKFLWKFLPVQKPKEKRSVVEDFKFLPTINRPTQSVPATIPPESVVDKLSTELAHPPQKGDCNITDPCSSIKHNRQYYNFTSN